jgi:hypothetical protein
MKTGQELISRIAELSRYISDKAWRGGQAICARAERETLRKELAELPDLTCT